MSEKFSLWLSRGRCTKNRATIGLSFALATAAMPVHAQGLPPRTQPVITTLHAEGVQIYECKTNSANALIWQFREPLATLVLDGKTVGRHYGGPTWEVAGSGAVVGKVILQSAGETKSDIPWLKLDVVDRWGDSAFSKGKAVERINTHGGVFSGSCERAGALHSEPYSADYVFLGG